MKDASASLPSAPPRTTNDHHHPPGWPGFTHQLARDLKLWLWIAALLFVSRSLLIWSNRFSMADTTGSNDYLLAYFTGFRFDMPVATLCTLPSFLVTCLCLRFGLGRLASRIRLNLAAFFTGLWVIITPVSLAYFKQYHNQFDAHMLGIIHDDFTAILTTIWKSYPVVWGSLAIALVAAGLIWLGRRWINSPFPLPSPRPPRYLLSRLAVTLFILATLAIGLRGSLGHRPMQKKDAGRTPDNVLNRCVINPFSSLNYAIKAHQDLMDADGLDRYIRKNPRQAFFHYAGKQEIKTVDDAFLRTASGRPGNKPKHIFLVIMESYDGWTLLDQHAEWNISNELKQLGRDGLSIPRFLPGSRSTMTSLASIVSGMADAGVITNERSHPSNPPYGTALAPQMKQLGYQTHFWYAGYASWQRIGDFCHEQGFDNIHMASEMGKDPDSNEWGVSDKHLFAHIQSQFKPDTPSFHVILTSSNHPPYTLDLEKENCPLKSVPDAYQENFAHGTATLNMLGHHWYSDKWMGEFVRSLSATTPDSLFAITADHWGRIFPGPRPSAFERAIVPMVYYGPGILPSDIDTSRISASHYDLGATLIELAAETGFQYRAIGENMFNTNPDRIAFSRLWLLGNDTIMNIADRNIVETIDGQALASPPEPFKKRLKDYNLTHGISWWRLRKGNQLPNH